MAEEEALGPVLAMFEAWWDEECDLAAEDGGGLEDSLEDHETDDGVEDDADVGGCNTILEDFADGIDHDDS